MERLYIDTDIILDLLMERNPHYVYSAKLFSLIEQGKIEGYVSSLIFSNLFYIIRKLRSNQKAIESLKKLKLLLKVLAVDEKIIELALNSNFKDFEDAIQYYATLQNGIGILITRNKEDYKKSDIILFTAEEYLNAREY